MDWKLELVVLPVADVDRAKAFYSEQVGFNVDVSEIFHFGDADRMPGPDPERRDHGSFMTFSDPDGNSWVVHEVKRAAARA